MTASDTELLAHLSGIVEGLNADGYTVDAHWAGEGKVDIVIGATADACEDCLVPKKVLQGIAATMLTSNGVTVAEENVSVTYPEGSAAH